MTPKRCRKVAAEYRKFPPGKKINMKRACGCAAGIVGLPLADDIMDAYETGAAKIMSILAGRKVKDFLQDGGNDPGGYFYEKKRVYEAMKQYNFHINEIFGNTLIAYGKGNQQYTTAGWLAKWWDNLADLMEAKKGARR